MAHIINILSFDKSEVCIYSCEKVGHKTKPDSLEECWDIRQKRLMVFICILWIIMLMLWGISKAKFLSFSNYYWLNVYVVLLRDGGNTGSWARHRSLSLLQQLQFPPFPNYSHPHCDWGYCCGVVDCGERHGETKLLQICILIICWSLAICYNMLWVNQFYLSTQRQQDMSKAVPVSFCFLSITLSSDFTSEMEGFDDPGVFFSSEFSESHEEPGTNLANKKLFQKFIEEFQEGNFSFKYRDTLKRNYLRWVLPNTW